MTRTLPAILALTLAATTAHAYTLDQVLDAIRQVESDNGRDTRDGDGGKAVGPYQIHRDYHTDSRVEGDYENCRNDAYARRVVIGYMQRYEPSAIRDRNNVNAEAIARCHNAGLHWRKKMRATDGYWAKVRRALEQG